LRKIVADWNLTNKISAVVTDNAANIKTNVIKMVISILLYYDICVPCFAHTLSLAVKDAILKKIRFQCHFDQVPRHSYLLPSEQRRKRETNCFIYRREMQTATGRQHTLEFNLRHD
jgi:hypothetical protein